MNSKLVTTLVALACVASLASALHIGGKHAVGSFNAIECQDVPFGTDFGSVPNLLVTMDHRGSPGIHDALSHWVTEVTSTGFRACTSETGHFDQEHDDMLYFSWFAYTDEMSTATASLTSGGKKSPNCETVNIGPFTNEADVRVHATLNFDDETAGASVWVEEVFVDRAVVCVEGMHDSPYTGPVTVTVGAYEEGSLDVVPHHSGEVRFPRWDNTITSCQTVELALGFEPTWVLATINHRTHLNTNVHHASTVWVEDFSSSSLTLCAAELEQWNESHDNNLHVSYTLGASELAIEDNCPTVVVPQPTSGQAVMESTDGNCITLQITCD